MKNKGMSGTEINDDSESTCFLMVEPESMRDSGEIARKLARCKGVRGVHLTSGEYGFVVAAKANPSKIVSEVRRVRGSKVVKIAVSQLVYKH